MSASTWRICPSAVTMVADTRLSVVNPKRRPASPWPPPSVRPAMPTEGQEPDGVDRPRRVERALDVDELGAGADRGLARSTPGRRCIRDRSTTTPLAIVE